MALARRFGPVLLIASALASPEAQAACLQELAVYSDRTDAVSLEFQSNNGEAIAVSNKFRLLLGESIELDGVAMWSEKAPRPNGMLMLGCPEGDVTGAEIEACTIWRGVIYAIGDDGAVGLLPREGSPAAQQLLFPDLGWAMANAPALASAGPATPLWDVLELTGCQE